MKHNSKTKLYDVACNFEAEPFVSVDDSIQFSWKIQSNTTLVQNSYQIYLFDGEKLIWDSEKKNSRQQINISYSGPKLDIEKVYSWFVTVSLSDGSILTSNRQNIYTECSWENSQWICSSEESETEIFSTKINGEKKQVENALIYISALGIYQLEINGKRVGSQNNEQPDMFYPGWTDYNKLVHYQCFDISNFDTSTLSINATLGNGWFMGQISQYSDYESIFEDRKKKKSLIVKVVINYSDGTKDTFSSNTTDWKYRQEAQLLNNDFYDGEVVDYSKEKRSESKESVQIPNFKNSLEIEKQKLKPSNRSLVIKDKRQSRQFKSGYKYVPDKIVNKSDKLPFGEIIKLDINQQEKLTINKSEVTILDFAQNTSAGFEIEVENISNNDAKIIFETGEMLNDGKTNPNYEGGGSDGPKGTLYQGNLSLEEGGSCLSRVELIVPKGETILYETKFTFHGFRYVKISANDSFEVNKILQIPITSAISQTGFLKTNNEDVNQLINNTMWSQKSNYLSIPTDCPQRSERVGWTGDAQIFLPTAIYNYDVFPFLMNYADVINASSAEAQYSAIIPQAFVPEFSGLYSSGWSDIGVIIVWELSLYSGSNDIIEKYYDNMDRYMKEIGGLDSVNNNYDTELFGDWLSFHPASTPFINLMYRAYCALLMAKMSRKINRFEEEKKYSNLYKLIKDHVQKNYVEETSNDINLLTSSKDEAIQKCYNGYSFVDNSQSGLIWFLKLEFFNSEEQHQKVIEKLRTNIENKNRSIRSDSSEKSLSVGFLGINVLLPTLATNQLNSSAYDLLLSTDLPSWLYSVKNGATTIWERWNSYSLEDSFADASMNSFNHYSYGSILEWLYQYAAGIKYRIVDGIGEFELFPMIDKGNKYNDEERIFKLSSKVETIAGLVEISWESENKKLKECMVSIPANSSATFFFEIEDDLPIVENTSAKFVQFTEKNGIKVAKFEMPSGQYHFSQTGSELVVN